MNKELIMKSDVLDILFENRNKAYGAYDLRKFYSNRLIKATGIMIAVALVLSAFTFLPQKNKIQGDNNSFETTIITIPQPTEKKKEVEKPKAPERSLAQQPTTQWTKPKIVDDKAITKVLSSNLDSAAIGSTTTNTINTGGPQIITPANTGGGEITEPVKTGIDKTTPIDNADVMPAYPGGMDALRRFLEKNLQSPKDMEAGDEVDVKIKFVVGYDGKLQSFVTVQDGGEAYNKEVIRVLKKMPDWVPGKSNGENVSVYYVIPVKFVPAE
jgi:protein TonB